jgi:hypothetical protein
MLGVLCWSAGDAVRQGRDQVVHEALLRVRRLLRSELQAVVALAESLENQDGSFSGLQAVQLLQHEQLLPGEAAIGDQIAAESSHQTSSPDLAWAYGAVVTLAPAAACNTT